MSEDNKENLEEEVEMDELEGIEPETEDKEKELQDRSQVLKDNTVRLAADMGREAVVCSRYEKFKENVIPIIIKVADIVEGVTPVPFNLIPKLVKSGLEVMQKSNSLKEIFENTMDFVNNFVKSITKTFSKNEITTENVGKGADFVTGFFKNISEPITKAINNLIDKGKSTNLQTQQFSEAGNEFDSLISSQQQASLDGATQDLNSLDGLTQSQKQQR